jgi:hypothetical protein
MRGSAVSVAFAPDLRGNASIFCCGKSIVVALARGISELRLSVPQRRALDDGTLTIISAFAGTHNRVITADLARQRNRFIAAVAEKVIFAFVSPGGSLSILAEEITAWRGEYQHLHKWCHSRGARFH